MMLSFVPGVIPCVNFLHHVYMTAFYVCISMICKANAKANNSTTPKTIQRAELDGIRTHNSLGISALPTELPEQFHK